MNNLSDNHSINQISNYLKSLEQRISRIEEYLDIPLEGTDTTVSPVQKESGEKDSLEFRIGQFWMARVSIVLLSFGIIFLLTFPYQNLSPILPSLFGYVLVAGIFGLSYYWRESFSYISRYLLGGGLVLLYFSTMRLYFFSSQPFLENLNIELLLLLTIVIINLFISVRRKSVYLVSLNLLLGYVTAIVSNHAFFVFILLAILSATSVYFKLKYEWHNFIIFSIIITYFTHLIWFINNPFIGNELQINSTQPINLPFLLVYFITFAAGNFFRDKQLPEDDGLIVNTIINCLGCFVLYLFIVLASIQTNHPFYFILASIIFLIIAIAFWLKEKSKYSTFAYSIFGFIAMSAAIIGNFDKPDYFIWLCWQSLIVAIAAIWFRSKIVIAANFVIYLIIFLAYLFSKGEVSSVSISFGIVALLSARIINWQKHRLEIKTELMRNTYLAVAFIIFPYALYYSVPSEYTILSWLSVAIFYYVLSLLLNNIKYRWMALLTLFLTILYVFIIGTTMLEPFYRIVTFLVLGVVLLVISLVYTRIKLKSSSPEINHE